MQRNNLDTFRSNHLKNYFETNSPLVPAALWTICILWTIAVSLWTIVIINLSALWRVWMLWTILISLTFSYCCFHKKVSNQYFQEKNLLISFINTYHNWLQNFSYTHFLLTKGYGKCSLRRESVIPPFVEWFKTVREWFTEIYLNLLVFLTF